jgi:hypothetical protein
VVGTALAHDEIGAPIVIEIADRERSLRTVSDEEGRGYREERRAVSQKQRCAIRIAGALGKNGISGRSDQKSQQHHRSGASERSHMSFHGSVLSHTSKRIGSAESRLQLER